MNMRLILLLLLGILIMPVCSHAESHAGRLKELRSHLNSKSMEVEASDSTKRQVDSARGSVAVDKLPDERSGKTEGLQQCKHGGNAQDKESADRVEKPCERSEGH